MYIKNFEASSPYLVDNHFEVRADKTSKPSKNLFWWFANRTKKTNDPTSSRICFDALETAQMLWCCESKIALEKGLWGFSRHVAKCTAI